MLPPRDQFDLKYTDVAQDRTDQKKTMKTWDTQFFKCYYVVIVHKLSHIVSTGLSYMIHDTSLHTHGNYDA